MISPNLITALNSTRSLMAIKKEMEEEKKSNPFTLFIYKALLGLFACLYSLVCFAITRKKNISTNRQLLFINIIQLISTILLNGSVAVGFTYKKYLSFVLLGVYNPLLAITLILFPLAAIRTHPTFYKLYFLHLQCIKVDQTFGCLNGKSKRIAPIFAHQPKSLITVNDPEELKSALRAALDAGYRYIDTAAFYNNEDRSDLFIATKISIFGHNDVDGSLKSSLSKLKTDYIDLYLMHSCMSFKANATGQPMIGEDGQMVPDLTPHIKHGGTWKNTTRLKSSEALESVTLT
uniref:NADP-dependent oxidoreductase domain-containing protein n=1 Tax=Ditylenchus dipsaci TaxID=166011 RepID=A0A915DIL1_9BILA